MNIVKNRNKPKATRKENPINGHDSEVLAKSKFIIALSGEINSASRELDNDQLDFDMNFQHPWRNEQLIQYSQVKSGPTYGKEIDNEIYETKKTLIQDLKKQTRNVCLIWINRNTNNIYWIYIHPKSNPERIKYGSHHKLTPATRFDIARCFEKLNSSNISSKGARGITIKQLTKSFQENREYAKKKYKILKNSKILNPVLGHINCSNLAWKHISRRNRKKEFKESSFNTVNYLYQILNSLPNSIAVLNCSYEVHNNRTWRKIEYILKYEDAYLSLNTSTKFMKKKISVVVRVIETVIFPNEWQNESQLSQMISRGVTLKSFYYKNEKEIS